jgi:GTPase KRas protein
VQFVGSMVSDQDGVNYRLDIIDTAGQEEYRDMLGSLFSVDSAIDAYLLVYDITSETSLQNLEYFDELIEKNLDAALQGPRKVSPVKIVAGNKCDLSEYRAISSATGLAWAKAHGCGFMETSAKGMVNIEETFQTLIQQVALNRQKNEQQQFPPEFRGKPSLNGRNFGGDPNEKTTDKGGCCVIC